MLPHETSRLKVGVHHCQSFHLHRPQFSHQPMPSRSLICSVSHCRLRPFRREDMCASLNPPVPSVCLKMKPAYVENETSQMSYLSESTSTPSDVRLLSREGVKNEWKDEKTDGAVDWSHTSCWPRHDPIFISPSWFSAPPELTRGIATRLLAKRSVVLCG